MKRFDRLIFAGVLALAVIAGANGLATSAKEVIPLTPEGEKALAEYSGMLESLRTELTPKIPKIDKEKADQFMEAHLYKPSKDKKVKTVKPKLTTEAAAQLIFPDVEAFLSSDSLDDKFVKCAVLADATPRGLAEFAQQDPEKKKLIDDLLADPKLMKEMLYAGGAKAGRYGKAMEIFRGIQAANERAKDGLFRRLALALGLELAAPELCGYTDIDPVKRYKFYEKSYLDKELDSHFDEHSLWLLRQVVNDPRTEEDMLWLREMLWNYRPDFINAPDTYLARYVGLMYSEFGHKQQEVDQTLPATQMQQWIDRGGQCGPKAFFGRCLGRTFGLPVWGGRLRSHTAMFFWTPKGWTQILGVSWANAFWTVDQAESMRAWYFRTWAIARNYPDEFIKLCRAQWIGDVLGEEKIDGMLPETGGLWNALAYNKAKAVDIEKVPPQPDPKNPKNLVMPWLADVYTKEDPQFPEFMMKPEITADDKKVVIDTEGTITVPAVACTSPTTNTMKIVFMDSRGGGKQLHYKRNEMPEPIVYEVTVPKAGTYDLSANVVTVNREQFFLLTVNDEKEPIVMKMPYTVGKWGASEPVKISLKAGKNTLMFNRTVIEDFIKEGYKYAGPQFGGITMKSFTLKPAK